MASSETLEANLEYLSLSKGKRILYKISHFFTGIPKAINRRIAAIPRKTREKTKKTIHVFRNIKDAAVHGDVWTRLSFLFMGCGLFPRHQIVRGALYLAYEMFFIAFMIMVGGPALADFGSLGQVSNVQYTIIDPATGLDVEATVQYDDSFTIMLYSLIAIIFILILAVLWYNQLVDSLRLQRMGYIGRFASDRETMGDILDKHYDRTLLFLPMSGLVIFTILPIMMMILIAFTDYDYQHIAPTKLYDWVGMYNFQVLFSSGSANSGSYFLQVFGQVLLWTLVWAFFATFSNYFLGMIVAMIINIKGIRLKKLWRTVLITTIAVPQFVSLMLISYMFGDSSNAIVNNLFSQWGWISTPIKWLSDSANWSLVPKIVIIVINTWVGIPYTMLMCTGLLMNIPEDLYESAKIDGASPAKMYFKITLPYMLFVTGPYLLSQFVGNINNFNVIYLLSGGGPSFTFASATPDAIQLTTAGIGQTDLLITWIYKVTTSSNFNYATASVLGIIVFLVVSLLSLIFYNHSSAVKDEEAFQ
jgi:arabinogalactan oligomer/maltooligosaccharide transport system permease protein